MINLYANDKFKKLGAKWDGSKWVAPELAVNEFNEIKSRYYDDLVVVEINHNEGQENLESRDWGYQHVRIIAGYIVATARGRDDGGVLQDGIAVLEGGFNSAGSRKNYICEHSSPLRIRLKVSRNMLDILEKEHQENRYDYKLI